MKSKIILFNLLLALFSALDLVGQELHTQSNAVSIGNESNSITGWYGTSGTNVTLDSSEAYNGNYSIKVEATSDGWRRLQYDLDLVIGDEYELVVYAKKTANSPTPQITNWAGFSMNNYADITSTDWQEYTVSAIATETSGSIKIYTGVPATTGNTIYIDYVSIRNVSNGSASDSQPPTAPILSSTGHGETTVDLLWSGATDNTAVTGYKIFKDGTLEATLGNVGTYSVTGLNASVTYSFTVSALDAAGNESTTSNTVTVSTGSAADTQPPTVPALTSTGQTETSIDLSWSGATDNIGVTGYKIFKDGVLEATLGNVSTYTVTGLTASTAYNFTATALDAAGNESAASNSVSVTTDSSSGGGSSGGSVWSESNSVASYTGDVAIGTSTVPTGYKMAIDGKLITEEVKVQLSSNWPDYVFKEGYDLPTLEEIQKHIKEKGRLPKIPSADEVKTNGIELGEMNKLLLEKIEELTLHLLQQNIRIQKLEKINNELSQK
nr:fibronectin type III domain-containing protein [uncultured Allomuricauda sp.]